MVTATFNLLYFLAGYKEGYSALERSRFHPNFSIAKARVYNEFFAERVTHN